MKPTPLKLAVLALIALPIWNLQAQQDTWEARAAARFTPLTGEMKQQITQAQPKKSRVKVKKEHRILVFWRCEGFIHTSIPSANFALQEMAKATGAFTVDLADDYSVFTTENLKQYDGILFNNTTHLIFPQESQRRALVAFIRGGKGIIGIHAASDNFYEWGEGAAMMGGQFSGHPWTADGTWAFKLDDPKHELNKAFGGKGFWHQDEIYQYNPKNFQGGGKLRILLSLDMTKPEVAARLTDPNFEKHNEAFKPGPREVPVSWIREFGNGRLFYTNLGHREETYTKAAIMMHILDGIQYALGDLKVDQKPTAASKSRKPALAPVK